MNGWRADFSRPVAGETGLVFGTWEDRGPKLRAPRALQLACRADGRPQLRFTSMHGHGPAGASVEGRLELGLQVDYGALADGEAALPVARGELQLEFSDPDARSASLVLMLPAVEWPAGGAARVVARLGHDAALQLERLLAGERVQLRALGEVEIAGLAPRIAGTLRVQVQQLREGIARIGAADGVLSRRRLLDALAAAPEALGLVLELHDAPLEPTAMAELLLDRLRVAVFDPVPGPWTDEGPALRLRPAPLLPDALRSQLAAPETSLRPLSLAMPNLELPLAWRSTEATDGLVQRAQLPPAAPGFGSLRLDVNLPPWRETGVQLLATLRIPAAPPHRPQALERTVVLSSSRPFVDLDLRLVPDEVLRWGLATTAVVAVGSRTERWMSRRFEGEGNLVRITPSVLPVHFVQVSIGAQLAAVASVEVCAEALCDAQTIVERTLLDAETPVANLVVPQQLRIGEMILRAQPVRGGAARELGRFALADRHIDLADVPGYGAQWVDFELRSFPEGVCTAIDVRALDAPGIHALGFTADMALRRFTWHCVNPFRCGLEWRWRVARGDPPAPWSGPVRPRTLLQLDPGMGRALP